MIKNDIKQPFNATVPAEWNDMLDDRTEFMFRLHILWCVIWVNSLRERERLCVYGVFSLLLEEFCKMSLFFNLIVDCPITWKTPKQAQKNWSSPLPFDVFAWLAGKRDRYRGGSERWRKRKNVCECSMWLVHYFAAIVCFASFSVRLCYADFYMSTWK